VDPIELQPAGMAAFVAGADPQPDAIDVADQEDDGTRAWMINTDETHSPGATQRFLEKNVAAVWGYDDGPAMLQRGARTGDTIYAYSNGEGIVARGTIVDDTVVQATPADAVIPQCTDGNEWHLRVKWDPPLKPPLPNALVRSKTGAGLPVRNSFCRLWDRKVRTFLEQKTTA
jgi:hypothetical protein